jgi:hypothetical protein
VVKSSRTSSIGAPTRSFTGGGTPKDWAVEIEEKSIRKMFKNTSTPM